MNSAPCGAAIADPQARTALRRSLRARRAQLPPAERAAAARAIAAQVAATPWLQRSRAVGLYVSVGAEVSTVPLRALALSRGCAVYLPRIVDYRQQHMRFMRARGAALALNRHGIPEPDTRESVPARALSVVFLPVLAFDRDGTRLGSGEGYYDRLLAFRRHRVSWHSPLLIGLAYRCQELAHIQPREHDVPLDAVVTEQSILFFRPKRSPSASQDSA